MHRIRQSFFWNGLTTDTKDFVEKCAVCRQTQRANPKEPLKLRDIPEYPFQLVSTDIFKFKGDDFLLIADPYSGFNDFRKLKSSTSSEVIYLLRQWCSVHGIPEILESDGGPQYSSQAFREFATNWKFKLRISSPHYPQSNGFAERKVQTVKGILKKCWHDGSDPYLAMLLLLFGVAKVLQELRDNQKRYADQVATPRPPLKTGDNVRMQTGHREWKPAKVVEMTESPRSVIVETPEGRKYRRNSKYLHTTKASIPSENSPTLECESNNAHVPVSNEYQEIAPSEQSPDQSSGIQTQYSGENADRQTKVSCYGRKIKPVEKYDPSKY
ncbi:uncharacterized protein LOC118750855 [Rhagoletis pomonella]|uniref:uncharacterized protein LOC118750855 n=1 Tax=Rhagoletis pomonella TaxID=28610 RepID=UPI0017855D05|nr:uncharacterized protein LOC118750855 [Rhagoletis pomonella]